MIPNTKSREGVFLSSANEQSSFGMNITPEAMKILSSQIYQHKITAVVREYACNACDSHIDSGNTDPFFIKVPSDLDDTFRVIDYGLGLDDNGVRKIFSTYFGSTKRESAKATGFLGIGSKSGYSYADSFIIEATKDGVRRTYVAFFDEGDMPALNKLSEVKVDEPNGVEISMRVAPSDFHRFRADIAFVSSFLTVTPIILGGELWDDSIASQLSNNGWALSNKSLPHGISSLYDIGFDSIGVVMGGVVYPLTNREVRSIFERLDIGGDYSGFLGALRSKLFVSAPMGSVEFAASRESLSMTPDTQRVVAELVCAAIDSIQDEIHTQVKEFDHVVPAAKYAKDMLGFVPNDVVWKGDTTLNAARRSMGSFLTRMGIKIMKKDCVFQDRIATATLSTELSYLYGQCTLYVRDTTRTGAVKHTRAYLKEHNIMDMTLVCTKDISDRNMERVKHILGITKTKMLSEVIPAKDKVASKRADDTQVRGVWIDYNHSTASVQPSSIMETTNHRVAYADRNDHLDYYFFFKSNDGDNVRVNLDTFGTAQCMRSLGIDRIIFRNGQNTKKIEKLQIPNINDVIADDIDANIDRLKDFIINKKISKSLDERATSLYKVFLNIEADKVSEISITEELKTYIIDSPQNKVTIDDRSMLEFLSRLYSISTDLINDRVKECEGFNQSVELCRKKWYPLIPRLTQYDTSSGDTVIHSAEEEYILAMDLYREATLIDQM